MQFKNLIIFPIILFAVFVVVGNVKATPIESSYAFSSYASNHFNSSDESRWVGTTGAQVVDDLYDWHNGDKFNLSLVVVGEVVDSSTVNFDFKETYNGVWIDFDCDGGYFYYNGTYTTGQNIPSKSINQDFCVKDDGMFTWNYTADDSDYPNGSGSISRSSPQDFKVDRIAPTTTTTGSGCDDAVNEQGMPVSNTWYDDNAFYNNCYKVEDLGSGIGYYHEYYDNGGAGAMQYDETSTCPQGETWTSREGIWPDPNDCFAQNYSNPTFMQDNCLSYQQNPPVNSITNIPANPDPFCIQDDGTSYTITNRAVDAVGNQNYSGSSYGSWSAEDFKIDRVDPTFSATPSSGYTRDDVGIKCMDDATGDSGISTCQYYWDSGDWQNVANASSTVKVPQVSGNHTLYMQAVDVAGNSASQSFGNYVAQYKPTMDNPSYSANTDYCSLDYFGTISWDYYDQDSDPLSAYQMQISRADVNFSSDNIVIDYLNEADSSTYTNSYSYLVAPGLDYGTTYYWRVKVKDLIGEWSGDWLDPNPPTSTPPFTTISHKYPVVDFNFTPDVPTSTAPITFTDNTTFFDTPTSTSRSWFWDFYGDGGGTASSTLQNPNPYSYNATGSFKVILQSTDSSNYVCSREKNINVVDVGTTLPSFQEATPRR